MKIKGKVFYTIDSVVPNTKFNDTNTLYMLQVSGVSEEAQKALQEKYGIICKDVQGGMGFKAKSKYPFKFAADDGTIIPAEEVGNGSEVVVYVSGSYSHAFEKSYGKGPALGSAVLVTSLAHRNVDAEGAI